MAVNLYEMSVPLFMHQFYLWMDILKKGENFSQKRKIDPLVLVNARLAPDMYHKRKSRSNRLSRVC